MSRPVRVGLADSGINPNHPHVGGVSGGVGVRVRDGEIVTDDAWQDLLGHGTAAAAVIRGHAPEAELYAIRIFRRRLTAHLDALCYSIEWAMAKGLDVVNLSLGLGASERRTVLEDACARAASQGMLIVAAAETSSGEPALPGIFRTVVGVRADPELDEKTLRYEGGVFRASPWARPLRDLPRERNFKGVSLAVAHVTGIAARLIQDGVATRESVRDTLERRFGECS